MPSTRRTFLTTVAAAPFASHTVAATGRDGSGWTRTVDGRRILDCTHSGDGTLLLTRGSDTPRTVHAVGHDGGIVWTIELPSGPEWRALSAVSDGEFLVASEGNEERVTVARYESDRSQAWRHEVPVGYHENEVRVRQLGDGSVALVTNEITTHAVSMRVQCLSPDGRVRWDRTRDAFAGVVADTVDGDLVVGGYAFVGEFDGWLDRIGTDGTTAWQQRWPEDVDAAGFGPEGGVAVADVSEDGREAWRIRSLSSGGEVTADRMHEFDGEVFPPIAARRLPDGGARIVTQFEDDGTPAVLRTDPDAPIEMRTLSPFEARVEVQGLHPADDGYVLTGGVRLRGAARELGRQTGRAERGCDARDADRHADRDSQ